MRAAEQGKMRTIEICIANGYSLPLCFKIAYRLMQKPVLEYYQRRIYAHCKTTRILLCILKRKRLSTQIAIAFWAERYCI